MSKEWIIDVMGDLRAFAAANELPTLASQLDDVLVTASVEIAQNALPRSEGYDPTARGLAAAAG